MKRTSLAFLSLMCSSAFPLPLKAEPTEDYYTMDSRGCMIVQDCTGGVLQLWGADQL